MVNDTVAAERPSHIRYGVLALVAFAAGSAYLTRHCLAVANTTIQKELGWNNWQMGLVLSAFSFGYLICQVPGGWLGNRVGTRWALSLLSMLWSVLTLWTSAVSLLASMAASRFAFGMAQAGLVPISMQVVKDWIPPGRRGICSALITVSMSVGGALAVHYTAVLMESFHWRQVFQMYSVVGIVWALVFFAYFRTRPEQHPWVNRAELDLIRGTRKPVTPEAHGTSDSGLEPLSQENAMPIDSEGSGLSPESLARSVVLWALCAQMFFKAAGYNLFVTFFPTYLELAYGVSRTSAGTMTKWPLLGVIAGGLAGGLLVDSVLRRTGSKWMSRSGVACITLLMTAIVFLIASRATTPVSFVTVLSFGAALSGMSHPSMWTAAIDIGGRHTAVIAGIMNMAGSLSGVLITPAVGRSMDTIRDTGGDWNFIIYLHATFYLSSAVAWLFVNPNRVVVS
jgi:sugar phosphate permease